MRSFLRTSVIALCFHGLLLSSTLALAVNSTQPWIGDSVLGDPEWRKSFIGSYGFLSGAEPQIDPGELELLRDVLDLMKANPRAAATLLAQSATPDSSAALNFILANLQFQSREYEAARGSYMAAVAKFPDFRRAHKNLGLLLVQQNDCKSAIVPLGRATELGDRDGRTFGLLGFCYLGLENPLAAESAYRTAILQQPEVRDWKLGLARSLLAMERHGEAAALFGSLIEENPDDQNAWSLQANAFLGLDQPMRAAVNLETLRMLGNPNTRTLVLLGDIYMNAGMSELATSAYLEVIDSGAEDVGFEAAYHALDLLIRTTSYPEAQRVLSATQRRFSEQLSVDEELRLLTLQAKLARGLGRNQEAAKLLESIVERDGTRGDALLELAAYFRQVGETERALLMMERAQGLEAYEREALLATAQLRVSEHDYAAAAGLLRQALKIESEPRVERFLARVEDAVRE